MSYTESSLSQIINGKVPLTERFITKLSDMSPEINGDWISTGHGDMILNPTYSKSIPLITQSNEAKVACMGELLYDSEVALQVHGNGMDPTIPSGSFVGLKLHHGQSIEPGGIYLLETHDGLFLKRLYYNEDKTAYRCVSDNKLKYEDGAMRGEYYYPEFEIQAREVFKLFRAIGVMYRFK